MSSRVHHVAQSPQFTRMRRLAELRTLSNFVDIHCHLLAGLDDGPPALEDAVALVVALADLGFCEAHPTPHQKVGAWTPPAEQRERAHHELVAALEAAHCPVRLGRPAGENMWDSLFLKRSEDLSFPKYVGEKAFLVEFSPLHLPPHLAERLFGYRLKGLLPVIAHVERYPEIAKKPESLERLDGKAALLVNLSSLGGLGGWGQRRLAKRLVERGEVHALTSDAHGTADISFSQKGLEWLDKKLGSREIDRLLVDNPRAILAGEIP